jgi:hypothetical protein
MLKNETISLSYPENVWCDGRDGTGSSGVELYALQLQTSCMKRFLPSLLQQRWHLVVGLWIDDTCSMLLWRAYTFCSFRACLLVYLIFVHLPMLSVI